MILHGLRGVGKTVLLNELASMARAAGWVTVSIEADRSGTRTPFAQQVAASLQASLDQELGRSGFKERMSGALKTLKSFSVTAFGQGVSVELVERGGTGSLNADLTNLVLDTSTGARDLDVGVALFVDELQHLETFELAALCQACHAANQQNKAFLLVGAGLPNLPRVLADAVSYAERLFEYRSIGRLSDADATLALVQPALEEGAEWQDAAVEVVLEASDGYPYFIQQFGQSTWDVARDSTISQEDATIGVRLGRERLDNGFFRARWDRATPAEREFMAVMALDSDTPSETGVIAKRLGKSVSSLGPARANLISKGLVWAPEHGQIAFSVPGMAAFIAREQARD
jgi:hypothetical protein